MLCPMRTPGHSGITETSPVPEFDMFPFASAVASVLLTLPVPPSQDAVRAAAEKALPLLVKGAAGHVEQKSCFACHNQAFPVMALTAARDHGFAIDADVLKAQADHIASFLGSNRDRFKEGKGTGGQVDTAGYAL